MAATAPLRVLLVELRAELTLELSNKLAPVLSLSSADAAGLVDKLLAEPPALAGINLDPSQGWGFGPVNRVSRMEALAGLRIMLVGEKPTDAAIDAHKTSATPAAAYARRHDGVDDHAFVDELAAIVCKLLGV